ncbi:MAG: hypothetical protein BWY75_02932 [bacterium ADurb.Bin425]|nr:MAG: hypothetical protein BWY75_02932 [bacterium ADurb.Bin425]
MHILHNRKYLGLDIRQRFFVFIKHVIVFGTLKDDPLPRYVRLEHIGSVGDEFFFAIDAKKAVEGFSAVFP